MFMPPYGGCNFPYKNNLNWLIDVVEHLLKITESLSSTTGASSEAIAKLQEQCQQILQRLQKVENGEFATDWLMQWAKDNIANIVYQLIPMFMFGINDEGYFFAEYPDGWDFITWFTSLNPASEDYGKLQLSY